VSNDDQNKGHLTQLCKSFSDWYNNWRPHEFHGSATPATVFRDKAVPFVLKNAKNVPENIMTKRFEETKVTAFRIRKAA